MTDDYHGEATGLSAPDGGGAARTGYIEQAGAICLRHRRGRAEVLLIKGLRNGKWGIPKGGVEAGETTSQAAAREAFEEAGVSGRCRQDSIGSFQYRKQGKPLPCRVSVHLLEVRKMVKSFPEVHIRTTLWTDCKSAANLVEDVGLKRLLQPLG